MKILIAVDGSPSTGRLLDFMAERKEWFDARNAYAFQHTVLAYPHRAIEYVGAETVRRYYEEDAEKVFEPIRARLAALGLEASFAYAVGHAAESIADKAERERFDLVVMGSHGHGALMNVVLGSVVTQVLARCKVPVLLVR